MKFNHLNVPTHWQNYWTRYPEGHTILEALISWVSQVDSMVDNQNKLNDNVEQFRNEIDAFVGRFDERLQDEVTQTLNDWQTSGFLDVVISSALQWQLDDYIATNEQDKLSLTAQLQQITSRVKEIFINVKDFGAVGDGVTDDTAAVLRAFDYATSSFEDLQNNQAKMHTIYFPAGIYKLTQTLQVTTGVTLLGERPMGWTQPNHTDTNHYASVLDFSTMTNQNDVAIRVGGYNPDGTVYKDWIADTRIDTNINVIRSERSTIKNLAVMNKSFTGVGVQLIAASNPTIENNLFYGFNVCVVGSGSFLARIEKNMFVGTSCGVYLEAMMSSSILSENFFNRTGRTFNNDINLSGLEDGGYPNVSCSIALKNVSGIELLANDSEGHEIGIKIIDSQAINITSQHMENCISTLYDIVDSQFTITNHSGWHPNLSINMFTYKNSFGKVTGLYQSSPIYALIKEGSTGFIEFENCDLPLYTLRNGESYVISDFNERMMKRTLPVINLGGNKTTTYDTLSSKANMFAVDRLVYMYSDINVSTYPSTVTGTATIELPVKGVGKLLITLLGSVNNETHTPIHCFLNGDGTNNYTLTKTTGGYLESNVLTNYKRIIINGCMMNVNG